MGQLVLLEKLLTNYLRYSIHNRIAVEQSLIAFAKAHAMRSVGNNAIAFVEARKRRWASAVVLLREI
ncbi:MAG: hypothetical protein VX941_06980 [Pseudomonadota bacterium]|nr:hypothetical protein [Pseudomonadota bacterium]